MNFLRILIWICLPPVAVQWVGSKQLHNPPPTPMNKKKKKIFKENDGNSCSFIFVNYSSADYLQLFQHLFGEWEWERQSYVITNATKCRNCLYYTDTARMHWHCMNAISQKAVQMRLRKTAAVVRKRWRVPVALWKLWSQRLCVTVPCACMHECIKYPPPPPTPTPVFFSFFLNNEAYIHVYNKKRFEGRAAPTKYQPHIWLQKK